MSYDKKHISFDGTYIQFDKPGRFNDSLHVPYDATSTERGSLRISTQGKLEYYDHVQDKWIQAGGAGLYYQEAGVSNPAKETNIFGDLYNLDATWYFGTSITTPLSFYEAEGT